MQHGERSMWRSGCRCGLCERNQERRKEAAKARVVHGTTTGYNYGCRCEQCTEAVNIYQRTRLGGTAPKNSKPKFGTIKSGKGL